MLQRADRRQEPARRVFGVQPRFQRMAVDRQFVLALRQRLPGGHAQLPLHQVGAGDALGDRMLHLQAGVHFHEVERAIGRDDELHGAGADVAHRTRRLHRGLAHRRTSRRVHAWRGGFLQHLLVAALHRAVAFEQVDQFAVRVAEHLDLDVPRPQHVLLHQDVRIAECGLRLALAGSERGGKVLIAIDPTHALAATTGAGLDQHRVADGRGLRAQEVRLLLLAVIAGRQRHPGGLHQRLGRALVAHRADRRWRRSDEHQPARGAGFGELGVLGQEAVAGMDGLRAAALRGLEDALAAQVALARRRGADVHGLVGQAHVARVAVGIGVHGHGGDAELAAGGDHPAGDLAAIGDEDLVEGRQVGGGHGRVPGNEVRGAAVAERAVVRNARSCAGCSGRCRCRCRCLALALAVAFAFDLPGSLPKRRPSRGKTRRAAYMDVRRPRQGQDAPSADPRDGRGPGARSAEGAKAGRAFFWLPFLCASKEK
ncbi:hypothetical protein NB689_001826 [Xanthomonas sacchari]|nr:hypothetical protein [Xanthomonas sacchari]